MKQLAAAAALLPAFALAGPIDSGSTTLYGDPRPGNPGGIELLFSGAQDGANEDIWNFTVDFTADHYATHAGSKLSEFYFNLDPNDATQWVVSNVTAGYNVLSPATVQGGGNNSGFLFELDQQPPTGSGVPLEFTLQYLGGEIVTESFLNALDWVSNDALLDSGPVGAHVLSLTVNDITCPQGGCSDSGFAVGQFDPGFSVQGEPDPDPIDAPGMAALLSMGLAGLFHQRRKNRGVV